MKAILYKDILLADNLTIADKMVFCQILVRSLWNGGELSYDISGRFQLDEYINELDGWVPISGFTSKEIAESINISRRTYFLSVNNLQKNGYIIESFLGKMIRLINIKNFFVLISQIQIPNSTKEIRLSGEQLIVYSYIYNREQYIDKDTHEKRDWVNTYHASISEYLNISEKTLSNVLSSLYKKNLICRKRERYQVLLKTFDHKK